EETTYVLKIFIIGLENLLSLKVMVIKCDNGSEFKNSDLNQFCGLKGSGPAWLFDIDSLTKTMNYHPVIAENQTNSHAGTQIYVLFPVLFDGSTSSQNNNKDALVNGKEHDDDIQKSISSVSTAGHNFINSTNDFSAAGPSNFAMPNLENPTHSDDVDAVGAEADINNLESIILVSHIPTTRIYKDHPTSQIIGDLSSTTQTR
nr:hypothetical protein [Tanacetum cinerariifolium]